MNRSKRYRWLTFLAALISIAGVAVYSAWYENHTTMGVQILSQEQRDAYTHSFYEDLSSVLKFNGELAAVDVDTSTIYLSQNIVSGTRITELPGKLTLNYGGYTLRFAPDDRFSDLAAAVEDGHRFSLLATKGDDSYVEYHVVFTTLPVMRLDGYYSYDDPDEQRNSQITMGDVCLWAGNDPSTGRYSVKSSATEWHLRGGTTRGLHKSPWKLSLKKEQQQNYNVDLLGMGADDDWILNPMVVDDTDLKEKLFMQLWNSWADQVPWNHRISTGEYVELVLNRSYAGVYLLQRRIDRKYLQLGEEDILLKGGISYNPESLEVAYEIRNTPLDEAATFELLRGIYTGEDTSIVDLDNFVDTNLFLQFAVAMDNRGYKNMFYLLEKENDGYRFSLVPWDTDMAFGMIFNDEIADFTYNYQKCMESTALRQEYTSVMRQVPELDALMAKRWQELRKGLFSEENIQSQLEQLSEQLHRSGAADRDSQRWGSYFGGADTEQQLHRFIQERLTRLDAHFAAILVN